MQPAAILGGTQQQATARQRPCTRRHGRAMHWPSCTSHGGSRATALMVPAMHATHTTAGAAALEVKTARMAGVSSRGALLRCHAASPSSSSPSPHASQLQAAQTDMAATSDWRKAKPVQPGSAYPAREFCSNCGLVRVHVMYVLCRTLTCKDHISGLTATIGRHNVLKHWTEILMHAHHTNLASTWRHSPARSVTHTTSRM